MHSLTEGVEYNKGAISMGLDFPYLAWVKLTATDGGIYTAKRGCKTEQEGHSFIPELRQSALTLKEGD